MGGGSTNVWGSATDCYDYEVDYDTGECACYDYETGTASSNVTVVQPYAVAAVGTVSEGAASCGSGQSGWTRYARLRLQDQNGYAIAISGIQMADTIYPGTPYDLGVTKVVEGATSTDSSGTWTDQYFVCSPACPSSGELDAYVGLMMVPNGIVPAFDWLTNTQDGESVFASKLSTANTCMGVEQQSYPNLPSLSGSQLEENALVFYSGNAECNVNESPCPCADLYQSLYWVPSSDGTRWLANSSSPGYTYVGNVESNMQ